jgi:hypothetical protein
LPSGFWLQFGIHFPHCSPSSECSDTQVVSVLNWSINIFIFTGKQRGKIEDVFDTQGDLSRSTSEPEFLHNPDSGFGDEVLLQEPASIFDRPGFGSVAFR